MKKIKVEGFFDDLFKVLNDKPNVSSGSGSTWMNNHLKPHTVQDLYDGVILRLRKIKSDKKIHDEVMPAFFPESASKSTLPDTIDTKLIDMYLDKMEDAIVEFCTKDAIDIIKRVQDEYKKADKDIEKISGDQYFGTILQQIHTNNYDLRDKLKALYSEFNRESKKKSWQVEPDKGGHKEKYNKSDADDIIDNILERTVKLNKDLTADDVAAFLKSDEGAAALSGWLAKNLGKR